MSLLFSEHKLQHLFNVCSTEQVLEFVPLKRSIRLHGHSTTIRLEKAYWTVLEQMAEDEELSLAKLLELISDTCLVANDKNLASCLRVLCLKYINIYY
ncbi:ribbon-helix-helix domain-containing protein [Candidatus Thioglobus sp.]|nr:ribbon-helix-helix domain-containing protein [Candidatus Thioglobus sp.]MDB3892809.1 ribbon-helix-helix domain-containing protein [Candidatus Thioglobus sp.]MDC0888872.1 ribbon-helix-helix domain-containing protein [Candidatus Thioglobus sp.]MDC0904840.1 ribbon-helix-helix domain-containing protein [Candidatus Thioglobus sp.]MDC0919846.1 ribbon-helix-helix domain-containing protein [Candidatus Thioglobus sp.]